MDTMPRVALSLGCNVGRCRDTLQAAVDELRGLAHPSGSTALSSLYASEPWGRGDQPEFLNIAVVLATEARPADLLASTQAIEARHGRQRGDRWGPRTLDIDLLLYGEDVVSASGLSLPHPRMHERRFVLMPLAEIAPDWMHPVLRRTISELAASVVDPSAVTPVGRLD